MGAQFGDGFKVKDAMLLNQCLVLSLVGSLVEKRERYVPTQDQQGPGHEEVRQGHEGEML
jgi:hypothetical protein